MDLYESDLCELCHYEPRIIMSRVTMRQAKIEPGDLYEPASWILVSQSGWLIEIPLLKRS